MTNLYEIGTRKDGKPYTVHGRRLKRIGGNASAQYSLGIGGGAVLLAYICGEGSAYDGHKHVNPFPPGRRHDAWEDGYNNADPLGWHHGRNR